MDRAHHRAEGLLHADAVDLAEQLEELALDGIEEPDQPRGHAAGHLVAFEILDGVQASLAADLGLQLAPGELGDEHFVLEGADGEREHVAGDGDGRAGDFGDHGKEARS